MEFAIWLLIAVATGYAAKRRRRSPLRWGLLGLVLPLISLLALVTLQWGPCQGCGRSTAGKRDADPNSQTVCPVCGHPNEELAHGGSWFRKFAGLLILLLIPLCIILFITMTNSATQKAKAFCERVKVGDSIEELAKEAKSEGARVILNPTGRMIVSFRVNPESGAECFVFAQDGKATGVKAPD